MGFSCPAQGYRGQLSRIEGELLLQLKNHDLEIAPELDTGDGATSGPSARRPPDLGLLSYTRLDNNSPSKRARLRL